VFTDAGSKVLFSVRRATKGQASKPSASTFVLSALLAPIHSYSHHITRNSAFVRGNRFWHRPLYQQARALLLHRHARRVKHYRHHTPDYQRRLIVSRRLTAQAAGRTRHLTKHLGSYLRRENQIRQALQAQGQGRRLLLAASGEVRGKKAGKTGAMIDTI
jgi:hypothetical protein